ncbi:MAG: SRPBCC family protein [Gammaproteobacteria bacterium]
MTGDWQLVRRVGEVELYRRSVKDSEFPALRGHARFAAPIDAVFRVVSDYDHFAGFIPLVSESRVVRRNGRVTWVYQRLALPLWFADRHYVIRVVDDLHAPATGVIDIDWQLDEKRSLSLPDNDALLPEAFSGSWHLETTAGQAGCDAVYTLHVDPGGTVPAWLFVHLTGNYVIQVMNAVRNRIALDSR